MKTMKTMKTILKVATVALVATLAIALLGPVTCLIVLGGAGAGTALLNWAERD